jgi:hypothetical protein
MKPRMCSVWAWKYIYVSISSNNKCCIEGGLINFNYKCNLAFRIILAFFPSLIANVLWHNHLVELGVEGRKVTPQYITNNSSHFSSMCFQIIKFGTLQIMASKLAPSLCHVNNFANDSHLYIQINRGIKKNVRALFVE